MLNKTDRLKFEIIKKDNSSPLMRVGIIHTPHGPIQTPAFIPVGTKATVKAILPENIKDIGAQAVLANTYHLYLQPGQDIVAKHGGFANMMNWTQEIYKDKNSKEFPILDSNTRYPLPTFTDSGGFQVFSLGAAFESGVSKIATNKDLSESKNKITNTENENKNYSLIKSKNVTISEKGVDFKSIIDGSKHFFSPEKSVQIQHSLGADIFFAFDECTSPLASHEYQSFAMNRTHRWAKRCLDEHTRLGISEATKCQQSLFAVVQGGAYEDLRKESANILGSMDFDGYGIGGSFTKEDMDKTVKVATENLPQNKPRHLLGIGEPIDFFIGIEYGIDTFDCVTPTRIARHGNLYTEYGKINLRNTKYRQDFSPASEDKSSPIHNYTKSYLAHLYRSDEMVGATLASQHNIYFLIKLVQNIRQAILENRFYEYKNEFCNKFYGEGNF